LKKVEIPKGKVLKMGPRKEETGGKTIARSSPFKKKTPRAASGEKGK